MADSDADLELADEIEPTAHGPRPNTDLSRRRLLQIAGAGGATAVGLSGGLPDRLDPTGDSEAAIATGTAIVLAGGIGAASGLAAIAMTGGGGPDEEEINEAEANELWDRVYADALEMSNNQGSMLTSMQNNASMLRQNVRTNVAFTIAERTKSGDTKSEVQTAAEEEVNETVSDFEKNLFNFWTNQIMSISRRFTRVDNQDGIYYDEPYTIDTVEGTFEFADTSSAAARSIKDLTTDSASDGYQSTINLTNGESYTIPTPAWYTEDGTSDFPGIHLLFPWAEFSGTPSEQLSTQGYEHSSEGVLYEDPLSAVQAEESGDFDFSSPLFVGLIAEDRETGEGENFFSAPDFMQIHDDLLSVASEEVSNASQLVDQLYQPIKDGEVDASDIASGRAVLQASQDPSHYGEAAGVFRGVNMPEAEHAGVVEFDNGIQLEGILFWTLPDGETLPVGEQIDPSNLLGEIHMAAEVRELPDELIGGDTTDGNTTDGNTTDGDTTDGNTSVEDEDALEEENEGEVVTLQITEPFEIVGLNGGVSGPLAFEDRSTVEPDQTPEDMMKALIEAYENEQESRQERQEIIIENTGGGGPMFPDLEEPDVPGGWLGGVAIIGGVVTGVSAFVSKVLP